MVSDAGSDHGVSWKRLYDEFSLVAEDAEECDVEFALAAQSEVVLADE